MSAINIDILEVHVEKVRSILKKGLLSISIWDVENGLDIVSHNSKPRTSAKLNHFTLAMQEQLQDIGLQALNRYYIMDLKDNNMAVVILHDDLMEGWLIDTSKVKMGALFSIAIPDAIDNINKARKKAKAGKEPSKKEPKAVAEEQPKESAEPVESKAAKLSVVKTEEKAAPASEAKAPEPKAAPTEVPEKAISDEAIARLISESDAAESAQEKPAASSEPEKSASDNTSSEQLAAADDYLEEFFDEEGSDLAPTLSNAEQADKSEDSAAPEEAKPEKRAGPLVLELDNEDETAQKDSSQEKAQSKPEAPAAKSARPGPLVLELETSNEVDAPTSAELVADKRDEPVVLDVSDEAPEVPNESDADAEAMLAEDLDTQIDTSKADSRADEAEAIDKVSEELDIDFGGEDLVVDADSAAAKNDETVEKPAAQSKPKVADRKPLAFEGKYFKLIKWPNVTHYEDRHNLAAMNSKLMRKHYDLPSILKWGVSEEDVKSVLTMVYNDGGLDVRDEKPKVTKSAPPKQPTAPPASAVAEPAKPAAAPEAAPKAAAAEPAKVRPAPKAAPAEPVKAAEPVKVKPAPKAASAEPVKAAEPAKVRPAPKAAPAEPVKAAEPVKVKPAPKAAEPAPKAAAPAPEPEAVPEAVDLEAVVEEEEPIMMIIDEDD